MGVVVDTGLLTRGLKNNFFERFNATPTYFQDLATTIPSDGQSEAYKWLGSMPQMREWGNGRIPVGLATEGYNIVNAKYELTIEVDGDEFSDDQTGQLAVRVGELAPYAASHKDYLLGALLDGGGTGLAFDGLSFFNDAHYIQKGTKACDNNLTSVAASDSAVPTVAEFKSAFVAAVGSLTSFKDENGRPVNLSSGGLQIIVPSFEMAYIANEALAGAIQTASSNLLLASMNSAPRIIHFPWLTAGSTTQTFYVLKTDMGVRPFILQDREKMTSQWIGYDSENYFQRETLQWGVRARYAMAYGLWQKAIRYVFTT